MFFLREVAGEPISEVAVLKQRGHFSARIVCEVQGLRRASACPQNKIACGARSKLVRRELILSMVLTQHPYRNTTEEPLRSSRPSPRGQHPRGIFLPKISAQNGGNIIAEPAIVKR
jgi:hypothetical protein